MLALYLLACNPGAHMGPDHAPKGPPPPGVTPHEERGANSPPRSPESAAQGVASGGSEPASATASATLLATVSFVPPRGALADSKMEAPGRFRILGATSADGKTFKPTNEVISDQANVPDMVIDSKGTLYLYYTAGRIAGKDDALAVATSTDKGKTWVHRIGIVNGARGQPTDPDVTLLSNGTFRMYYTAPGTRQPAIYYAESADGMVYTHKGEVFAPEKGAMDPNVYRADGLWHMFAFDAKGEPTWYATSKDGTQFTPGKLPLPLSKDLMASNAVNTPSGVRMFTFSFHDDIRAWSSADGRTWKKDPEVKFPRGDKRLEGSFVKDPAAVRLPDGSWYAVYVSRIP